MVPFHKVLEHYTSKQPRERHRTLVLRAPWPAARGPLICSIRVNVVMTWPLLTPHAPFLVTKTVHQFFPLFSSIILLFLMFPLLANLPLGAVHLGIFDSSTSSFHIFVACFMILRVLGVTDASASIFLVFVES